MEMRTYKNLPIYLLSASLLFVGVTSISQAQGATSTANQILALQKQVNSLKSELQNTHAFVNIIGQKFDDRITALENKPQSQTPNTEELTYAVVGNGLLWCTSAHRNLAQTVVTYSSPYVEFGLCTTRVLVP
jgi:hypothetical protein